jgi:hypothetical protein
VDVARVDQDERARRHVGVAHDGDLVLADLHRLEREHPAWLGEHRVDRDHVDPFDAAEVADLIVARARYTLESSYELDVNDPNIMLAAMAGAALVAHLADQLLALHAMPPSTAAAVVKLAQSAEFAFAQGFRFVERSTAPGD